MLKLMITNQAEKAWRALPAKQFKQIGVTMLQLLADPYPHDSAGLKGARRSERRVDIGEDRLIYVIVDGAVEVLVIGKRNDDEVYKRWDRRR